MSPSLNSTFVTKPPTRALTCTSSTASKRPVNSSQSVTVRLTGCATVTGGGGGAADACCCRSQPANTAARRARGTSALILRTRDVVVVKDWSVGSVALKEISSVTPAVVTPGGQGRQRCDRHAPHSRGGLVGRHSLI